MESDIAERLLEWYNGKIEEKNMEFTEKMKEDILAKARAYVGAEKDRVFREEVENAIEMEDWEGLYDRFYTSLAFGTAGMRGVIGGGTNRINTFMVCKVTQGLSGYLRENCADPSCVIAYDSRLFSSEFSHSAARVLAANGVRVYLYDSLRPVPVLSFEPRTKGEKICSSSFSGMPGPSSAHAHSTESPDSCSLRRTVPPFGLWRSAFLAMLETALKSASSLAKMPTSPESRSSASTRTWCGSASKASISSTV